MSRFRAFTARTTVRTTAGSSEPARVLVRSLFALAVAAAVMAGCEGQLSTDSNVVIMDKVAPTVKITPTVPQPDSAFVSFDVQANDNLGLLRVVTGVSGLGVSGGFDTTFNATVTSIDIPYRVQLQSGTPQGDTVTVISQAMDGSGNSSAPDTARIVTTHATP